MRLPDADPAAVAPAARRSEPPPTPAAVAELETQPTAKVEPPGDAPAAEARPRRSEARPRPAPTGAPPIRSAPTRSAPTRAEPVRAEPVRAEPVRGGHDTENGHAEHGATAPQLRRFIKSRAYVPMHELRRRFAINGADDEVTAVDLERQRVFVGLPDREGRLLGELLRGGDIGYELSLDPITPIVVGVYPMRPVTRA